MNAWPPCGKGNEMKAINRAHAQRPAKLKPKVLLEQLHALEIIVANRLEKEGWLFKQRESLLLDCFIQVQDFIRSDMEGRNERRRSPDSGQN